MPRQLTGESLVYGMDHLSRSDRFLGRVKRRQNYKFWRYASFLMICGTVQAISKSAKDTRTFVKYQPPSHFRRLSQSKGRRKREIQLGLKIAKTTHTSEEYSRRRLIPLLKLIFKDTDDAAAMTGRLGLDEDDVLLIIGGRATKRAGEIVKLSDILSKSASAHQPKMRSQIALSLPLLLSRLKVNRINQKSLVRRRYSSLGECKSMVVYSAPAKIYLFGEHAYHTAADTRYIKEAVKVFSAIKDVKGVEIDVKSDIPIGAGLGSSAAVTVATLGALNDEFDGDLNKTKIANLAFKVEKSVQGVASPTDTFVSTVGGIVLVPDLIRILDTIEPAIVIGDTRTVGSTKELVEAVGELRSREPEVVDLIFDAIDTISTLGYSHLKLGDYARVGEFMNINHGLLDALGVGSLKLSTLVDVARSNGALGAKITGAGGGGCIVTICERDRVEAVCDAIKAHGGDAIVVDVANDGLRREE